MLNENKKFFIFFFMKKIFTYFESETIFMVIKSFKTIYVFTYS